MNAIEARDDDTPLDAPPPDPFRGLPAIFRECVDPDTVRYGLSTPWRDGPFVYATDGRILARVPIGSLGLDADAVADYPARVRGAKWGEAGRRPDAAAIYEGQAPTPLGGPAEIPAGVPARVDCENCLGDGQCQCDNCHHVHDCGACGGAGTVPSTEPVKFGAHFALAGRYAELLRRHGATLYPPAGREPAGTRYAARWTLGYVEGYVAGLTGD